MDCLFKKYVTGFLKTSRSAYVKVNVCIPGHLKNVRFIVPNRLKNVTKKGTLIIIGSQLFLFIAAAVVGCGR